MINPTLCFPSGIIAYIIYHMQFTYTCCVYISGAVAHRHLGSRMENFSALDPRKQELLEARLLGNNRVSLILFLIFSIWYLQYYFTALY